MSTPKPRAVTPRERNNNGLRIAAAIIAVVAYAPMMVFAEIVVIGGGELQTVFEWMTGRCSGCSVQRELGVLVVAGLIALTLPGLIYGLYIWVRRGRKTDFQVTDINYYFKTMPERVPPAAVDMDPVERRFYRDRQGRLRPMDGPEA